MSTNKHKRSREDIERMLRLERRRQARQYAADAKDARVYYQVPDATPVVLAKLVSWRKGERCEPFDRANRWSTFDETMLQHHIDAYLSGLRKYGIGWRGDLVKTERRVLKQMYPAGGDKIVRPSP